MIISRFRNTVTNFVNRRFRLWKIWEHLNLDIIGIDCTLRTSQYKTPLKFDVLAEI